MDELLRRLLSQLDDIGASHEELYDTDCRERLSNAVMDGFVRGKGTPVLPDHFGLHGTEANQAVRAALAEYVDAANKKSTEEGNSDFHHRLSAFQNPKVQSDREGNFYDDFFGCSAPEQFDPDGNALR